MITGRILWSHFDGLFKIGFRVSLIPLPERGLRFVNIPVDCAGLDGL